MAKVQIEPENLTAFADYVRSFCGMDFSGENSLGLKIAIRERMKDCHLEEINIYFDHLKADAVECEKLICLLSVPETYFFRDKQQFDVLVKAVLPEIIERKRRASIQKPRVKIISCGCSTGAEPYSVAIAVLESGLLPKADFEINALDINRDSIEYARRGRYTKYFFRESNTEFLRNYFESDGSNHVLNENVKAMVRFEIENLFDFKAGKDVIDDADIIFFRNVQIYFNDHDRSRILTMFSKAMAAEGYLFLGYSETLIGKQSPFRFEDCGGAHIWRLKNKKDRDISEVSKLDQDIHVKRPKPVVDQSSSVDLKPKPMNTSAPLPLRPEESHYEEALGYMLIKQIDKAEQAFQAQLSETPQHVKSLEGLAQIYADSGRDEQALDICDRAVAIDNLFTGIYFITGSIHYKQLELEEAVNCFKKAIYCEEAHFLAQYYLAASYELLGKMKQAQAQYQTTIAVIHELGEEGLRREIAGYSANYVLSLCVDSVKGGEEHDA